MQSEPIIVLCIFFGVLFGIVCYLTAKVKGYSGLLGFFLGFFLFFIGRLIVWLLPKNPNGMQPKYEKWHDDDVKFENDFKKIYGYSTKEAAKKNGTYYQKPFKVLLKILLLPSHMGNNWFEHIIVYLVLIGAIALYISYL